MLHRTIRLAAVLMSVSLLGSALASGAAAHGDRSVLRDLFRAAVATARFHDVDRAEAAGYALPPEGVPLHECIVSFDGTGAMGFHYINGSLLDTTVDPRKPEALVYAPDRRGRLHLVALEYVVFQEPWIAEHGDTMPTLFGQMFMATPEPNRFDIPAFFSLHVWLWKFNPSGLFAPFNPRVSCGAAADGGGGNGSRGLGELARASSAFQCGIPLRRSSAA